MTRPCEICSGMILTGEASSHANPRMRRVILEGRVVALCDDHANVVLAEGIETLASLQDRFRETSGQRSSMDRRSPLDRRMFPPRPEGRRRSQGRRSSDPMP